MLDLAFVRFDPGVGGLLYLDRTEDEVSNQAGGLGCNHPLARGSIRIVQTFQGLDDHFGESGPYAGWCSNGITEETADLLDQNLKHLGFKTDREKLKESQEAWIFGRIDGLPVVLTWQNSD